MHIHCEGSSPPVRKAGPTRSQESGAWTGKGGKYNTGSKGGKGGSNNGKGIRIFIETNREIIAASWRGTTFATLLAQLRSDKRPLNGVNISTILHRSAKLRHRVDPLTLVYLSECLSGNDIILKAQEVGNALYGLQSLGDSKEVRGLLAALTPKVQQCGEVLSAQNVGNALYGLQSLGDSIEVRGLLAALTPKVQQCSEVLTPAALAMALCGLGQHFFGHELYKYFQACVGELSGLKVDEAAALIQVYQLSGCADQIPLGLAEQFRTLRSDFAAQISASKTEEAVQKVRFAHDRCIPVLFQEWTHNWDFASARFGRGAAFAL